MLKRLESFEGVFFGAIVCFAIVRDCGAAEIQRMTATVPNDLDDVRIAESFPVTSSFRESRHLRRGFARRTTLEHFDKPPDVFSRDERLVTLDVDDDLF